RQLVLELGHLGLVEPLGVLGGVILGVLGKVAVIAYLGNLLDNARTLFHLEAVQFGLELLEPLDRHRHFFHGPCSRFRPAPHFRTPVAKVPLSPSLSGLASPSRGGAPHHPQDAWFT